MDASTRRTRFEERVRVEREFLVPVNQRFGQQAPLAGMTAGAIELWRRRASDLNLGVDVERVAALLLEAAARAELLADNSRDVFEASRHIAPDGLAALRDLLEDALKAETS
ncbi:hypothetical protein VM77_04795 [Citromicrobium sp. JL31]|nr:hypothetical protein WG74_00415 [Citromicrobium sp. JL477]KPM17396.1 hypothetical protein VO58_06000 [Citromicrobium sp. JL1351]KPM20334.1 hypothetical protein VM77_04795 [Citromicrobium sp. JL31]KPM29122.1 hypothetical protein VO57_03570 [Citromicrobium sp. JL2201]